MDKNKIIKIGGTAAIVLGSGALYVAGAGESTATGIVAAVFVLGGVISALFKE